MKNLYRLKNILIITGMLFFFSVSTYANWIKAEQKMENTPYTLNLADGKAGTPQSKSDSLPAGVTKDWLNSLLDESGNPIISEDPEGDALQRRTFNGAAAFDEYGYSVSSAGDVNSDGFEDVIIGAPAASGTGRAYIYYGGFNMNTIADVIFTGEAENINFGASVSEAGDVNGDGYSDVIVGAYGYNSPGRVNIYYGGAAMNNVADVTMSGETPNSFFGLSVSGAGDLNGDGYSDVIVGAYGYGFYTGRAYIYYGGAVMNSVVDVIMTGELANIYFGISVSGAGDVNGDGSADVIVGASGYSSNIGKAYIYYGGVAMDTIADVILTGEAADYNFGYSVSGAGDVNNDGYADVIVGAWATSSATGRAYIYYGWTVMNNIADVIMAGEATGNRFGISVSGAGDINGDGYADVIVGAYGYSSYTGRAYIYYGGAAMNNVTDITMTGEAADYNFGYSVSGAGDVNGDGYSDVIVGAYGIGSAYVYTNTISGEDIPDLIATGEAAGDFFGYSVSSAGDVNGDGYTDVIVGAYAYSATTGRAYIYYGGPLMDNVADVIMTFGNLFGYSVSGAGDVNGDGYADVIVGSHLYNSYTGRAHIFFGGSVMDNIPDVTMYGESVDSYFGYSVSGAGDVNNDGYADVIVGAYGGNTGLGRSYVYYGGAVMNNFADVTMQFGNLFGYSVSGAGDVNGDGYADVIVGSHLYNSYTGRAMIFYGDAAMDPFPDVTMYGESVNSNFGASVSGAGDVNGDGYADLIIGAYGYNSVTGRAYVYYGGTAMNDVADVILTGEASNNGFGYSVAVAGDANGDGYSDVIVGAYGYSSNTGRTYIYYGSAEMNSVADVIMTGEAPNNYFGLSVSGAGDLNNDGFADLIVGAYGYNSLTGRAYIFLSSPPVPHGLLNLSIIMEGFYDNVANNMRLSDTASVYLRNSTSPYEIVDSSKGVINQNTFTRTLNLNNATTGNYYIVVKHRNCIETWSASPFSYTINSTINYSFITSAYRAFGNNMKQVDVSPIRFAIYSGDVNQDGVVDGSDAAVIDNDAINFVTGYVVSDLTGDGVTDGSDGAIADNNAANFVSVARP